VNHTHARSRPGAFLSAFLLLGLAGCRSAFIRTTITNQGQSAVRLVEVDYPSASFGIQSIAAFSEFHYRFKIQGSGAAKLEFTDVSGKVHDSDGPLLHEGQEGRLSIVIQPNNEVNWDLAIGR
jgi:hypothetical protein